MPSFKHIKEIKSILDEFPGIKTYKELDILIEVGYHQEMDTPLTVKQLLSLGIASQATVRRHLDQLIQSGMVTKGILVNDHRAVILLLSPSTIKAMLGHIDGIIDRLTTVVTKNTSKSPDKKIK